MRAKQQGFGNRMGVTGGCRCGARDAYTERCPEGQSWGAVAAAD